MLYLAEVSVSIIGILLCSFINILEVSFIFTSSLKGISKSDPSDANEATNSIGYLRAKDSVMRTQATDSW